MTALPACARGIAVGLGLITAGCATTPPTERMEASAGAIRAAEEVGARGVPRAALYLQLAQEQSERAKTLIARATPADRGAASSLLSRAQADAELALALAREDSDRMAAQKAMEKVSSLLRGTQAP